MSVERNEVPWTGGERELLVAWLDWQRGTLATKCEGLSAEQLRMRAVEPSSMSLLGLVRHMADVERGWFRRCLAREDARGIYFTKEDPDGDFDNVDDADADADLATWRSEVEHARVVMSGIGDLDFEGKSHGHQISARWVLIHMIEEYARHNGHADFLRERIDGATGY
jgi:uncharacterized damage-inducible protein DinB